MKEFEVPEVAELRRKMICQRHSLPYRAMSYDDLAMEWCALMLHASGQYGKPIIPGFDPLLEAMMIIHRSKDLDEKFMVNTLMKAAVIERTNYTVKAGAQSAKPIVEKVEQAPVGQTAGGFQIQTFEMPDDELEHGEEEETPES